MLLRALAVPELAGAEQRQQRRVPGEDAEVAVRARDLDLVDRLVHERTVGRDDLQLNLVGSLTPYVSIAGFGLPMQP